MQEELGLKSNLNLANSAQSSKIFKSQLEIEKSAKIENKKSKKIYDKYYELDDNLIEEEEIFQR